MSSSVQADARNDPCTSDALTQEVVPSVTTSMLGCYAPPGGSPTFAISYARSFVAPVGGMDLVCVEFGVGMCAPAGHVVTAHVWMNGQEVSASAPIEIPLIDQAAEIGSCFAVFDPPLRIDEGEEFLVEVRSPSRVVAQGGDGGVFFFGGNQAGETHATLVKTVECGAPEFVPLTTLSPSTTRVVHLLAWYEVPVTQSCGADLDTDGTVDAEDLALLLGAWATRSADLTGDGNTDAADLALLLGAWGECP
jgi:hypothetical protein